VSRPGPDLEASGPAAAGLVGGGPPAVAAVMGAGSWGTTFAKILADAGCDVRLWARRPELARSLRGDRCNPQYLPGVRLPASVHVTADAPAALAGAGFVVIAVPSQMLRQLAAVGAARRPGGGVRDLLKGVELGTTLRMSEVVCQVAGVTGERVAVVSGPNLAREIAAEQPAATVVSCTDEAVARRLQAATRTPYLRPYTNRDVVGCELGGAVKNVIAIACGMAEGMGFGDNTRASIITRGLAQTARLGVALGADPMTFAGLAGLGDLVATCSSPLSRNRSLGEALGRGASLAEVVHEHGQVAEGVTSCQPILQLAAGHGIGMSIVEHVVLVMHEGVSPREAMTRVMSRDTGAE